MSSNSTAKANSGSSVFCFESRYYFEKNRSENTGVVKNALFPTDMGMLVTDFLESNFDKVMDYGFTAGIEKKFDSIAEGPKSTGPM